MNLDSRIRELHIARYGATDDVEDYLRTLESLHGVSGDRSGENHHMLARSIWSEYKDLKTNPWNRLRVSRALHTALTELQSRFEERLQRASLLMKGQSVGAFIAGCRRAGKIGGALGGKRTHELHPNLASECGKRVYELSLGLFAMSPGKRSEHNKIAGKIGGKIGGKRVQELYPNLSRENGKRSHELGVGVFARSPEEHSEHSKIGGKIGGTRTHELHPNLLSENAKIGGKRRQELYPNLSRENAKTVNCIRWNIRRGKTCICGKHITGFVNQKSFAARAA